MKHLSILIPDGQANLMKIVGTREIFELANEIFEDQGYDPVFTIQFVGCAQQHAFVRGFVSLTPELHFKEVDRTDLIIIPAIEEEEVDAFLVRNQSLLAWLINQYRLGAQIASLCTGTFLLAATGLLDRKQCSTHWTAADEFQKRFPKVKLVTSKIITEEKGLYTSAGSFSSFNLLLYLIEKLYDRPTAVICAKDLELDIDRRSQSPYVVFAGQKDHEDEGIRQVQDYIEANTGERLTVESLAAHFAISKRNLERRFKKATHNTPVEYIQRVKMEAAKKQLETSRKTINEVMYEVGYMDVKAFRTIFRKITGLSPLEYRAKYNEEY
ncbi:helix-turn-helix domain-containing protein [Rhodocytophaga aerolata]|uniref:Helix-turn-helix domain-containing protein n=1 Tax=Rhodocytophaga aerolata TaxID=455078 RepID=A0ABT8RBE9_9BACT|nr:helix-turn-helix domain-containing protein [Rhodocytophaga aerolata]MDO1449407.1 helix-turn-helix domain-containing protein [Rhodocytophaga aerolata]